jgi:hypothetical protein
MALTEPLLIWKARTMAHAASKRLLKEFPSEEEMQSAMASLSQMSHHAAALLGVSYLERALDIRLKLNLRQDMSTEDTNKLWGYNAILGTFSSKILISYATFLIGVETKSELSLINDIRNVFAHSLHTIDFGHPLLREDVHRLIDIEKFKSYYPVGEAPIPPVFENFCLRVSTHYHNLVFDVRSRYSR